MNKKTIIAIGVVALLVISAVVFYNYNNREPGQQFNSGFVNFDGTTCLCFEWTNGVDFHSCNDFTKLAECREDAFKELQSDMVCNLCFPVNVLTNNTHAILAEQIIK